MKKAQVKNWAIALVRYENTRNYFSNIDCELKQIIQVVAGKRYARQLDADRVISRWERNGLPPAPACTRERMENGRYQFYQWDAVQVAEDGTVGYLKEGEPRAYRTVEQPYINQEGHPERNLMVYYEWPDGMVAWFDQAEYSEKMKQEENEKQHKQNVESPRPRPYYGDVTYYTDIEKLATALINSISYGAILKYSMEGSEKEFQGAVIEVKKIEAANKNRNYVEWRVMRLNDHGKPVYPANQMEPVVESVWPIMLTGILQVGNAE